MMLALRRILVSQAVTEQVPSGLHACGNCFFSISPKPPSTQIYTQGGRYFLFNIARQSPRLPLGRASSSLRSAMLESAVGPAAAGCPLMPLPDEGPESAEGSCWE